MEAQTYTPAQIRTNHERATKAAAALSKKHPQWYRAHAELPEGQPAIIVTEARAWSSFRDNDNPWETKVRYVTRIDQTIGVPVTYSNEYTANNGGTMCWGVHSAEKTRSAQLDGLRKWERDLEKLRAEVAAQEARIEQRRKELGL